MLFPRDAGSCSSKKLSPPPRPAQKKSLGATYGMNRHGLRLMQGLVFAPAVVFVNDILIGLDTVVGDTQLNPTKSAATTPTPCGVEEKSWVLVNRMSDKMHGAGFESGDLVVMTDPCEPKRNLVRKVVKCGKDWIRVQDGANEYHVYIKGGYCWVVGREENSEASPNVNDSRTFGPIPQGLILGIPIMVSWPLSRMGVFSPIR